MDNEEIVRNIQKGDNTAMEQLYSQNEHLFHKIFRRCGITGEDIEDALQDAYIALHKAAHSYTANSGIKFSTYAYTVIMRYVCAERRRRNTVVYTPMNLGAVWHKIKKAYQEIAAHTEKMPTAAEVADALSLPEEYVIMVSRAFSPSHSLNAPANSTDGDAEDIINFIPDKSETLENYAIKQDIRQIMQSMLKTLTAAEQKVIQCRYMSECTLQETAAVLSLTLPKVRRIELRALQKLRHYKYRTLLQDYI